MTTLALEINSRQHLEMMLSMAKKLKIKSKVFENDIMTPYEKTINGDTMTLKQLTEHLDNIADNGKSMSYDEFKKRLEEWK
ncbi:MAG: hypothetical protein RLZZ306_1561 [Bacteroidota bacterium]|jgi:hypothetical protein